MKKILLSLASVALMMSACTQDVAEQESNSFVNFDGDVTVTATMTADTRTAMSENAAGGLDITWVEGDAIGLSGEDELTWLGANIKYTANQSAATTGFVCAEPENAIKWGEGTHYFYAYYPYTEGADDYAAVPATVPAVQNQSAAGNTDHLQPYSFLYAACEASKTANGGAIELQFKNAFSVLELDVCAESGSVLCEGLIFRADDKSEIVSAENILVELEYGDLNYSEATNTSNEIRIDLGEGVTLDASTPQKFYMLITPGHANKRFSFYAVVNGKEVLLGNKGIPAAGLPAGRKAVLSLNVPAVDLSADGTANCYIANAANTTYKFKATVKGNGATATYNWSGGGNEMTRTISAADVALAPTSAKLLWTTNSATNTVVTDVELKDGYIYFKAPKSFINGNCVIAAMNASGEIVWSWHIWAVENYNDVATAKPIKSLSALLMDRNLGATLATEQANSGTQTEVAGLKYQWGRKDPFPAPATNMDWADAGNGGKGKEHYSPDGSISYYTYALNNPNIDDEENANDKTLYRYYNNDNGMQQLQSNDFGNNFDEAVAQSIKEPWRYHMGYLPTFGPNDNKYIHSWLWGNPTGGANEGTKTIYDPCPVGWKVASTATYDALKNSATTYLTYGVLCGDHYMPRTGNGDFAGSWSWYSHCNEFGLMWSDRSYNTYGYGTAYRFDVSENSQKIISEGRYGTTGCGVRCVSEESVDLSEYAIDLSANGTSNCYIVNKAGEIYKFNATVQGNGKATPGITPTTIAPKKAYLLWAQLNPISGDDKTMTKIIKKESVRLTDDGYVSFATNAEMVNGNACIAVTDDAGKILWSWHLWCVNGYNADAAAVTVTNAGVSGGFQMMDRNLGASSNGSLKNYDDYSNALGMWYQWGRKDPFLGIKKANGYYTTFYWQTLDGTINKIYTYDDSSYKTVDLQSKSVDEAVAYTIANPMVFATGNASPYKWLDNNGVANEEGTAWNKLWGNISKNSSYGLGKKSIYDPCPVGWRVPEAQCFTFITSHGDDCSEKYSKQAPWKINTATPIYNKAVGASDNADCVFSDWFKEPYGLEFYVHGKTTADENLMPIAPEDKTVSYFSGGGFLRRESGKAYKYNNYGLYQCNSACTDHSARRMSIGTSSSGFSFYARGTGNYEQLAHACYVRCIKE